MSKNIEVSDHLAAVPRWRSISNALRILRNPIPIFNDYVANYGDTFKVYIAGVTPAVFSTDPAFTQHVLQKNHRNFRKSEIQTEALGTYVGKGLLTTDGDYWLQQRRLIQPGFHKKRLEKLQNLMERVIDQYLDQLEARIADNSVVNIHQETLEVAHRIIVRSLFSDDLDENEMKLLGENITRVQEFLIRQIRLPFLDWWFGLSGQKTHHLEIARASDDIIRRYIHQRKDLEGSKDDLLQMLLEARYEGTDQGMSERQLIDETLILFIAGHETSANAMAWMIYLLSQQPEILERLQNAEDNLAKKVINESLRLYPPAWITDRVAISDDQFEDVKIPSNRIVISYIYGIHHSPKWWTNPEKFNPDRFDQPPAHPFAFMPFGGGPRLCIGSNFAMMEMEIFIRKFVERFDLELIKDHSITLQPLVTLRPRNGIMVKLCPKLRSKI